MSRADRPEGDAREATPEAAGTPLPRRRRRLRFALGVLGIASALCVIGVSLLGSDPVEDAVARELVRRLETASGGEVSLGRLELEPWARRVRLENLEITPPDSPLNKLSLEKGAVRLAPLPLLFGEPRPQRIELDGLVVETGQVRAPGETPAELPWELLDELRALKLRNGVWRHGESAIPLELELRDIQFGAQGSRRRGQASLGAHGGHIAVGESQRAEIDTLTAQLDWNENEVELRSGRLVTDVGVFGAAGDVSFEGERPELSLGASGHAQLAPFSALAGGDLDGQVGFKGRLEGSLPDAWRAEAEFDVREPVAFAGVVAESGRGQCVAAPNSLLLEAEEVLTRGGSRLARLEGEWDGERWRARAVGSAQVAELLERLGSTLPLAGIATGTLAAEGQGAAATRWELAGELHAAGGGVAPTGGLTGHFDGTTSRITLDGTLAPAAPLAATLSWPGDRPRGTVELGFAFQRRRGRGAAALLEALRRETARQGVSIPAEWLPEPRGGFGAEGHFTLGGAPHGAMLFAVERPLYGRALFENAEARVEVDPDGAWSIWGRLARADGSGAVGTVARAPLGGVAIDARARELPLALLEHLLGDALPAPYREWVGELGGSVRGEYAPGAHALAFELAASVRPPLGPEFTFDASGHLEGDQLYWQGAHLSGAGVELSGDGRATLPLGQLTVPPEYSMELDGGASLAELSGWLGEEGFSGQAFVRGTLSSEAGARSELPALDGEMHWSDVRVREWPLPDGRAELRSGEEGPALLATAPGLRLLVGISDPTGEARLAARLAWERFDVLEQIEAVLGRPLASSVLVLSDGEAQVTGPLRDPSAWQGLGTLGRLDLLGVDIAAGSESPVPLQLEPGGIVRIGEARPLRLVGPAGGWLETHGALNWWGEKAGTLEQHVRGDFGLDMLEQTFSDVVASGHVDADVRVHGTLAAPDFEGSVRIDDGRVRILGTGFALENLRARLALDGQRVGLSQLAATVGGGLLLAEGHAELAGWLPDTLAVEAEARDVALSAPRGVWGRYDAQLELLGTLDEPKLRGVVEMLGGRFGREFGIEPSFGQRTRAIDPSAASGALLSRVELDLDLSAEHGLMVRNEMAVLEAGLRLRLLGNLSQPKVVGQVSLAEGGRFTFRDVDYEVLSGQLVLDDLHREPARLQLRATTNVADYEVRLDLDASRDDLSYKLSSTPALPESEILILLLTGQPPGDTGSGSVFSRELATTYFGTKLGELLLAGPARRALGITRFRIAPSRTEAGESPTARLTVGRRLDEDTMVVYSRDLSAEGRDYYLLERDVSRDLRLALSRETVGGVGLDLKWRRRVAGGLLEAAAGRPRLSALEIEGWPEGVRKPGRRQLGLRRGDRLDRASLLLASEVLRRRLVAEGYLEARVAGTLEREGERGRHMRFRIAPGPRWELAIDGPKKAERSARAQLEELWTATEFRPEALGEAERVLAEALADEGYGTAIVELSRPDPEERRLSLLLDPGPEVTVSRLDVDGVVNLSEEEVRAQILSRPREAWSRRRVVYRPRLVEDDRLAVRALYESHGFLGAEVRSQVSFEGSGESVVIAFHVDEGPRGRIAQLRVVGDWPAELGSATELLELETGEPFSPDLVEAASERLRDTLDGAGYFSASVVPRVARDGDEITVVFRLSAGPRGQVAELRFEGLERTRRKLLEGRIHLEEGTPLTRAAIHRTERELFRLGLFKDVSVAHEPSPDAPEQRVVTIKVEESAPLSLLTGIGYDTEEKLRASVTVSHDNLTGRGRVGSLRAFASSLRRGVAATLEDRYVRRGKREGVLTVGIGEEEREGFSVRQGGFSVQLGSPANSLRRWQARYELTNNTLYDITIADDALDTLLLEDRNRFEDLRLGALFGTVIVDRRDDPFLPSTGDLFRSELGVWGEALGSEASFVRLSGQYARYWPATRSIVLAGSLRAGAAWPLAGDEAVPLSERFFAGGASTVRGFDRDQLGPLDGPGGNPIGGEAMLVLNLEARWSMTPDLALVLFHDAGNVWFEADDFNLSDLRSTYGLGVRYETPVGALRLEYGRKVDAREGESEGEVIFSIGEAF